MRSCGVQERGIPVVWIGVPPMRNDRLSADFVAHERDLPRERQRLGGSYVDIWPGFVDDENRYATGPGRGRPASRLRTNDGVLFTAPGARKAAHFADAEIKRLIEAKRTGNAGRRAPGDRRPASERLIKAALLSARAARRPCPAHEADRRAGSAPDQAGRIARRDARLRRRPKLEGDAAHTVQKALREGIAPSPRPAAPTIYRWPSRNRGSNCGLGDVAGLPARDPQAGRSCRHRGSTLSPIRYSSMARAAWRPSRIAQTIRDWPRRMSPAAKTLSLEVR